MSRFDYMNFSEDYGYDTEFVAHAKIFTKEQAIELCLIENDWEFGPSFCEKPLRKPLITDVIKRQVRYYPRAPEHCGYEEDGGCYTYCNEGERGSFPVWVIKFKDLEREQK